MFAHTFILAVVNLLVLSQALTPTAPVVRIPISLHVEESTQLAITGIKLDDDDADEYFQYRAHLNVTVKHGKLKLSDASGVLRTGDLSGDRFLELFGTLSNVQSALSKIYYTPDMGYIGVDNISISVSDLHYSAGKMIVDHAPELFYGVITVVSKKTAPKLLCPVRILGVEDTSAPIDLSVEYPVPAVGNAGRLLSISVSAQQGTITTTDGGCSAAKECLLTGAIDDINSALQGAVYTPPSDFNKLLGLDIVTVTLTDDHGTTTSGDVRVVIQPVNDAPQLTLLGEDTPMAIKEGSTRQMDILQVSDVDYYDKLTVTLTVQQGRFSLLAALANLPHGLLVELQREDQSVQLIGLASTISSFLGKIRYHPKDQNWYGTDIVRCVAVDSAKATAEITVDLIFTPVDTPPYIAGFQGYLWGIEDVDVTVSDVTVGDFDLIPGALLAVSLAAENGEVSLALTSSEVSASKLKVKFTTGDGSRDTTVALLGTPGDINQVLSSVTFHPAPDVNVLSMAGTSAESAGGTRITMQVYEYDVKSTEQVSDTVESTMQFLLKPVNDLPVLAIAGTGVVVGYEDTAVPLKGAFSVTDVDCITPDDLLELHVSTEKGVLALPKPFGLQLLESTATGIRVRGTPESINAALQDLTYR